MTESLKDLTANELAQHIINLNNEIQHYTQKKNEKGVKLAKQDLEDAKAELTKRKSKKEVTEARQNDIVAKIDPKHPLATKDVEEWTVEDQKEYIELWDKYHGNDKIKYMLKKAVTIKPQNEAKGTLCGRCGHVHVKGTPCPRPFKEGAKPDYLDLDKDGNRTEPMKKAAKDLKLKKEVINNVLGKLKEAGPMSPEDKKANDLEIQAQKAKIAAAEHRISNLQKGDAVTEGLYDFFERTYDDDDYVDVSGPSVEMTMEEVLMDFEERIKGIPEESREEALRAIKTYWINMIKDWKPDLTTPHRAPVTEAKHPILEAKEYDYEGQMARTQLISIVKNAKSLFDSIGEKTQLQAWVQSKLTKAEDYLNAVRSYLEGESISNTAPLMVNNEPKRDAEGTALNIGDVVRGADGRIYQAVHSYSEGKPFLTPFDLKKRKTINLSERHYFDSVNENEMSPIKTMYKVMPHTQTKGGFTK
jgi:hypothetical protein